MNRFTTRGIRSVAIAGLAVALGGCAVGPDFVRPASPQVKGYTVAGAPAALTSGAGEPQQRIAMGKTLSAQWWELYGSQQLNQTIKQALAGSPTLAAAKATLAQAQETLRQEQGGYYPQLNANAGAQHQHTSAAGGSGNTYDLYSLGGAVSFAPDLFGGTRRQVEQQQALADNQRYQLAAAYLTLTGNTVAQSIDIASYRQQLGAVQDIVNGDQQNLRLVQLKFDAGKASRLDVLTAQSQLSNDRTQLPPLQQQLSVARHALSVLIGRFPGNWSAPAFELNEFTLPAQLPLSVPSELVRRRPDILAAEAQLHASSAAIGVATAQLYPSLTLSGTFGVQSLSSATLFQGGDQYHSLAASLLAPIFQGGALEAQKRAAVDAFRASLATYRQTVLAAFGQVADVLRALEHDSDLAGAQKHALEDSEKSLQLQRLSYQAGKSDLLQLLDAERSYQQARLGYARAQAQRYQDTAQLFVAMGGGWWEATGIADDGGSATTQQNP